MIVQYNKELVDKPLILLEYQTEPTDYMSWSEYIIIGNYYSEKLNSFQECNENYFAFIKDFYENFVEKYSKSLFINKEDGELVCPPLGVKW